MQSQRVAKRQRHEEGRSRLMEAALRILSRKGFEDTSVEDICLAAGYSKGGFYFHFRGKDDLLIQLVEEAMESRSEGSASSREGWSHPLLMELWAQASRKGAIREPLARRHASRLEGLRQTMKRAQEPMTADVDAMADLLLALETGLQIQSQIMPSDGRPSQAQRLLETLVPAPTVDSTVVPRSIRREGARTATRPHSPAV